MNQDLKNIKSVIDTAVARGIFNNAESVAAVLISYNNVSAVVEAADAAPKMPG